MTRVKIEININKETKTQMLSLHIGVSRPFIGFSKNTHGGSTQIGLFEKFAFLNTLVENLAFRNILFFHSRSLAKD